MRCPFCDAEKERLKVIDSRSCDGGKSIRRRRECLQCRKRFTTYERVEEQARLAVIKRDGRRVPWDRNKIITGLERACFKRPVAEADIIRVAEEVEEEVYKTADREVQSGVVGQSVADKLRRLDQVAYVRFASVYKQFKTLEELVAAAQAVLDAKRFEDPTQGRLFLEASAAAAALEGSIAPKPSTGAKQRDPQAAPSDGNHRSPRRSRGRAPRAAAKPESEDGSLVAAHANSDRRAAVFDKPD